MNWRVRPRGYINLGGANAERGWGAVAQTDLCNQSPGRIHTHGLYPFADKKDSVFAPLAALHFRCAARAAGHESTDTFTIQILPSDKENRHTVSECPSLCEFSRPHLNIWARRVTQPCAGAIVFRNGVHATNPAHVQSGTGQGCDGFVLS